MDYDDNFNKAFQDHDLLDANSVKSGGKRAAAAVQLTDKHCHTVKRLFNDIYKDGKVHKFINIRMFSSGLAGSNIRNAVTGEYSRHLVGTLEQNLFFKVVMSTGEFKDAGMFKNGQTPVHLYYISPEQFEAHQYCEVDEETRNKWNETYATTCAKLGM
jgi:hypothetical protein